MNKKMKRACSVSIFLACKMIDFFELFNKEIFWGQLFSTQLLTLYEM